MIALAAPPRVSPAPATEQEQPQKNNPKRTTNTVSMLHLACKRKLDRPFVKSSHFFTTLHDRSGKTDIWSDWTPLHGDAIYPNQLSEVRSLDQPDHSFQAYAVSIEEMNSRSEGRRSGLLERTNDDDPYHQ